MHIKEFIPVYKKQSNKSYTYRFTVFTPVFNAENTLGQVHESLIKQTFTNFEWLIINDGSTDGSHEVITALKENSSLQIRYINNTKNQHKMACLLQAIDLANGELFVTFDADDACLENALETFDSEFKNTPDTEKNKLIAITGLCVDQNGNKVGNDFPSNPFYSNPFEAYAIYKIRGEKWGFTTTDALRGIIYSDSFISHGFMPEGLLWSLLAKEGHTTKYINEILRIYHIGSENSISTSGKHKTDLGMIVMYVANFNWFFRSHFFKAPLFFIKNLYFLLRLSNYSDFKLKDYRIAIEPIIIKFLFVLLWPFKSLMK